MTKEYLAIKNDRRIKFSRQRKDGLKKATEWWNQGCQAAKISVLIAKRDAAARKSAGETPY
jgi:hypothetical protein